MGRGFSLLALIPGLASAQLLPGDWVVTEARTEPQPAFVWGGIVSIRPSTGASQTFIPSPPSGFTDLFPQVLMAADNRDLLAVHVNFSGEEIERMTPSGTRTTLVSLPGFSTLDGLDWDQDGNPVCLFRSNFPLIGRVAGGAITTLVARPVWNLASNELVVDPDTGDWWITTYELAFPFGGFLLRVGRRSGAITTIASHPAGLFSLAAEPHTGTFLAVSEPDGNVLRFTRTGAVTTVTATLGASSIAVDRETGNLLVGRFNSVSLATPSGTVITTHAMGPTVLRRARHVAVYGSLEISGSGPATGGSLYRLSLAFPGSPGRNYVLALSTGLRPGIPFPDGRTLHLDVTSPLFLATLGGLPGITTGFAGALDAAGRAAATVLIPGGLPPDLRFFVSGVAVNPGAPSGLDVGNTWAFSTN